MGFPFASMIHLKGVRAANLLGCAGLGDELMMISAGVFCSWADSGVKMASWHGMSGGSMACRAWPVMSVASQESQVSEIQPTPDWFWPGSGSLEEETQLRFS